MTQKISLVAQKRVLEGKKVKALRRQNILPANLFGKGIKSTALQLPVADFLKVYQEAGETHLIELKVRAPEPQKPKPALKGGTNLRTVSPGETGAGVGESIHNVLIHNLQVDPVSAAPLHLDFQEVSLKDKISATVPIKVVGESSAEKDKVGIFVQQLSEVDVEALPTDLPDHLDVDISVLHAVGDTLYVKDLKFDHAKVTLKPEDQDKIIARIEPPAKEEVVTPSPTVEAVPAEGEAPAAGEASSAPEAAPKEETKKD